MSIEFIPLEEITITLDRNELSHLVSALFMYREVNMDHLTYEDVLAIDSILFRKLGITPSEEN